MSKELNPFPVNPALAGGHHQLVESERAIEEIRARMVIAKKFPRDQAACYAKIIEACKRKKLADSALYEYPRGTQMVTGPSIRMAEMLAQSWQNIEFGIKELSQNSGESEVEAYAWDLETNTRQAKIFKVKHERHAKKGITVLSDPRDIYELVANQGARRMRACILGIIPGDIIDDAVKECEKTMTQGSSEPLQDRVRKMVATFSEFGVTLEMIEKRLGHNLDATSQTEIVTLQKIYRSLKDGMAGAHQFFDMPPPKAESRNSEMMEKLKSSSAPAAPAQPAAPVTPAPEVKP